MKKGYLGLLLVGFLACKSEEKPRVEPQKVSSPPPLANAAVGCDPGHGGWDTGTWRYFGTDTVAENEYTYDMCRRILKYVIDSGGIGGQTVLDDRGVKNYRATKVIPDDKTSEIFAFDRKIATPDPSGTWKRVRMAENFNLNFKGKKIRWIAPHFDHAVKKDLLGKKDSVCACGVRIFYAPGAEKLAFALAHTFGMIDKFKALNQEEPLIETEIYGILTVANPIRQKVLIELGNMPCDEDFKRMLDPSVRETYALAIYMAIKEINDSP